MCKLLVFLFFFVPFYTFGQVDSIEIEIMQFPSSKSEIISKSRRLLIEKFLMDDYQKMKEIKDYLKYKIEDKDNISFSVREYWFILYWTQEFDELLSNIEKNISLIDFNQMNTIDIEEVPFSDQLFDNLLVKSIESKNLLEILINNSQLNQEEMDFLKLHLNYCLSYQLNQKILQDSLNIQGDKFILKYPTSPYRPFVKKVIQYKEKVSDFSFGYDFFIGYGAFRGDISNSFVNHAPFGFSMDMNYKNIYLNFGCTLGVAKLKQDIVYQGITWEKEKKADIFYPQASLGYTFFGKSKINLSPNVGVYSLILTPTYEDMSNNPPLENLYFQSDLSLLLGLSICYNPKSYIQSKRYLRDILFQGFIKLKYTYYQSGFKSGIYNLNGDMHTICLSFGGLMKRVYRI